MYAYMFMERTKMWPTKNLVHKVTFYISRFFGQISDFPSSVTSQIAITVFPSLENFLFGCSQHTVCSCPRANSF